MAKIGVLASSTRPTMSNTTDNTSGASEWAKDAHSALDQTVGGTQGSNLPGAYPDVDEAGSPTGLLPTGKDSNGSIIDAVKQTLPSQQDVVDTAKQYLPGPVAAYLREYLTVIIRIQFFF
jgi:hypothetical protein